MHEVTRAHAFDSLARGVLVEEIDDDVFGSVMSERHDVPPALAQALADAAAEKTRTTRDKNAHVNALRRAGSARSRSEKIASEIGQRTPSSSSNGLTPRASSEQYGGVMR